jgi:energy-coupling factor transport system ATP-binding protein
VKLRIEQVSFSYPSGVRALEDVSLEIASGECLALVGENGAGKTTLVKLFNGLLQPGQGTVWVGDWPAKEHSTAELAGRVGFLFQNPDDQLFERSVGREVAFGPRNLGLSPAEVEERVEAALQQVGLAEVADQHPYDLQYNQRKLVALAATLAMRTPVLVLDEPTIGQDAAQRQRVGEIISQLSSEGRTVILISHDLDFVAEHAERVVVMAGGRMLDDGPAVRILAQSETLAQAAVSPPQLVRLAQALSLPSAPLDLESFLEIYAASKKG